MLNSKNIRYIKNTNHPCHWQWSVIQVTRTVGKGAHLVEKDIVYNVVDHKSTRCLNVNKDITYFNRSL